jgi:hypothetical protein
MSYYPNTLRTLRELLKGKYPGTEAKEEVSELPSSPQHMLWMLDGIEKMENDPGKAGRWLGYCVRAVEDMGLLTNLESRSLIRQDVKEGHA